MPAVKPRARVAALCASLGLGLVLAGCEGDAPRAAPAAPPPQVTVARPATKMVTDHDEFVGRFVAVDAVEIRARVSGYLDAIHFTDGQFVKQGDLLFTIDRRPFQVALDQARANLAQAKANVIYATTDLARGKDLVGRAVISQQTFDQRVQSKSVAEANAAAQEAAVKEAALNLEYTELRADSGGVVKPTWLLMTRCTVPPVR